MQQGNADVKGYRFKHEDTTKQIIMRFQNDDGYWVSPNSEHKFVAKIANSTGYIGDYPVTLQGNQIILATSELTELVPDSYTLEIWESFTSDDGKLQQSIYPSPSSRVEFEVESNIEDSTGELIKQITFQDVVNKAVENAGLNLTIGDVTSSEAGSNPSVTQKYEDGKNVLSFTIPAGQAGTISVGSVTTVAPDKPASVTNSGTKADAKFDFAIPKGEQGERGFQGPAGKNFEIKKTFKSIADMNNSKGTDFTDGDFALISSEVGDPDNSKLYVWNGEEFKYIGDFSGAQGMKGDAGPAPAMHVKSVTKLPATAQPTVTYTKVDGGYDVDYALPAGPVPEKGKDYWNEADKAEIKKYVDDAILNGKW